MAISTSADASFAGLVTHTHPFERIVFPDDPERFIHVPTSDDRNTVELSANIRHSLDSIGVSVSTGPVVDFRLKQHLRKMPGPRTVPLLYPVHFNGQSPSSTVALSGGGSNRGFWGVRRVFGAGGAEM